MANEKMFLVAGVSEKDGVFKVRYANSVARGKVLQKNGHTNIVLVEFEDEMEKVDCVDKLLGIDLGSDAANECVKAEAREYGFIV